MATFGIVVGGGPAPGINGVISAATLAAPYAAPHAFEGGKEN